MRVKNNLINYVPWDMMVVQQQERRLLWDFLVLKHKTQIDQYQIDTLFAEPFTVYLRDPQDILTTLS